MSDYSDISITLTHDQVEEVIREELHDAMIQHKKMINEHELEHGHPENEDYLYSKQIIHAAAIILKYYTIHGTELWKEINEISDN